MAKLRARLLSLFKRSLGTHASLWVSDLETALTFYQNIGFVNVTASRSDEVILLRNDRGEELNLVVSSKVNRPGRVSFEVSSLERLLHDFQQQSISVETIEDAATQRARVHDPDRNVIEFVATQSIQDSAPTIYHLASVEELTEGLSEHYYLPPPGRHRFVQAKPGAAIVLIACARVAEELDASPVLIEMNPDQLSLEDTVVFDDDTDKPRITSSYPRVLSPIDRAAMINVGECTLVGDEWRWPAEFVPLDSVVTH